MSDTPKFTVIDRRKIKAEEEQESKPKVQEEPPKQPEAPAPGSGPRLVVNEAKADPSSAAEQDLPEMPEPPTAEESKQQKSAYDASAQRLEDLVRAQNPAMGPQPPVAFENLVQQFYLSAMIQMGAGTQEGQRPRVDILGAKQTIDLLGILSEKTKGNLTPAEDKMLETILFEVRMAFLELTSMISMQGMAPGTPPPAGKK